MGIFDGETQYRSMNSPNGNSETTHPLAAIVSEISAGFARADWTNVAGSMKRFAMSEIGNGGVRTVLWCVAVLLLSLTIGRVPEAHADPVLIQTINSEEAPAASISATFATGPVSGHLLVAIAANRDNVTLDSYSSGWSTALDQSANAPGQAILYRVAGASESSTLTVNYSGSTRLGLQLYEYSGIVQSSPLDATASNTGTGLSLSSTSITTAQSNELVIAGFVVQDVRTFSSWTNSFVEQNDFANSGSTDRMSFAGADLIAGAAGSYSTAVTASGSGTPAWRGQIAGFLPDALSVQVSDATFTFGTQLLNTWLSAQTTVITNDGTAAEDFAGKISQFSDGSNNWTINASANGSDQIRAQWSKTSSTGPWTNISAYDTDFTIATSVAVDATVSFWVRIQTPTSTTSYLEHAATLTVTPSAS